MNDTTTQQFSDVCTQCHTPVIAEKPRTPASQLIIMIVGVILLTGWLHLLGLILGIAGSVFATYSLNRMRALTCPSCGARSLIPVGTPHAVKIMKEHGWEPDDE